MHMMHCWTAVQASAVVVHKI